MPNKNDSFTKIAWNFNRINNSLTEIFIYDAIADKQSVNWWTGEEGTEITPKLFAKELSEVTTPEICVRINSVGGEVFAAEAIRTQIREKRAEGKKITCKIDGICASAAVGIASACESIAIPSSAYFMIHDPAVFAYGYFTCAEFEKAKSMLNAIKQGIINAYSEKTGKDKQEISDLMTVETWYTGDEAVENGFCDELMFVENAEDTTSATPQNLGVFNMSLYKNCPTVLLNNPINLAVVEHIETKNKGDEKNMSIKTVDELKAQYPELTSQIENSAAAVERKRIKDIENVALVGFEEVINKAKFESPEMSAAEVAMNIIAEQKKQGVNYLKSTEEDVKNSGINDVESGGSESGVSSKENLFDNAIDKLYPEKI